MQSIRSSGSSGGISEVKSLLDIVGSPAKLKAALEELETKTDKANEALKNLGEKQSMLSKIEKEQEIKSKELTDLQKSLSEKEHQLKSFEASIKSAQENIPAREAVIYNKEKEFTSFVEIKMAEIKVKESQAIKNLSETAELKAKAEIELKAYEEKHTRLKAAMGG